MASAFGAQLARSAISGISIFDVLAIDDLTIGFRTGLKYLADFSGQTWPHRLKFLYVYSDEVVLALELFLQYHHLKKYNASFAEKFYGVARDGKVKLLRTLLLITALPYLSSKLEATFRRWKDDEAEGTQAPNDKLRRIFLRFYPYFYFVTRGSYFLLTLLYTLGRSDFHCMELFLSGSRLEQFDKGKHYRFSSPVVGSNLLIRYLSYTKYILSSSADIGINALVLGAHILQMMEFWYQNNDVSPFQKGSVVPPPPDELSSAVCQSQDRHLPKGKCPLCKESVVNETVLTTSGFAFCYTCIVRHLIEHNTCPVTGYPSTVDALIKVYQ
ncbi:peroxisome assembly protein 12 [Galendromus occidentalis]|uniref:Peroxisome assembly protein 12 n=1 Tax=Galendromus occidentalis TaxID=34638 RepID=A0AAJ7PAU8_9ACAR|nr:peroxisome assembly protein 12 [Galendromus occidentalis]